MKKNRTLSYLFMQVKTYGNHYVKYLKQVDKIGVYISDIEYVKAFKRQSFEPLLFLHVGNNNLLEGFIQLSRTLPEYINDYPSKNNTHVIVYKVNADSHYYFMRGEYSKMYNKKDLDYLFTRNDEKKNVLSKRDKTIFEERLYKEFQYTGTIDDNREFDFPIKLEDEIMNYSDIYYNHYLNSIK